MGQGGGGLKDAAGHMADAQGKKESVLQITVKTRVVCKRASESLANLIAKQF